MLIASPEGQAHRRRSAVSPTFATGKISRGSHPQIRKKANRKLTARNIAKSPCRRDPISHSVLVKAASSAVRLQGRGKDCRDAEAAKSTFAYYLRPLRNDPEPRRAPLFGEATAVSLRPKVRPYERLCNTISSQRRQMAVPTFRGCGITASRWRDSNNPCGTPAPITAVLHPTTIRIVHPHEAMPNYNSHTANLLSRCLTGYAYSASSRMSRKRTDWRPTCRKSTCRRVFGQDMEDVTRSITRMPPRGGPAKSPTADGLIAATTIYSDFTQMPRQRIDRQPPSLKV